MAQTNVLDIRNLSVGFETEKGMIHAVNDISFTLAKGETVGIVGESGSGKTVSALSLIRLIPQPPGKITGGEILFNSPSSGTATVDLARCSENEIRKIRGKDIAMIFQEPMTSLNPVFTCGEQLVECIRIHNRNISGREAKKRAIAFFDEVLLPGPENFFDAYPHQLSGGQKQRVMIAMAISCNPAVLIADEPTTALDVTVQATILSLLKKLRERYQMSLIFISHDLGVISEVADRVMVMYKGKFVEQGTISEVFIHPAHPYTKGLLACRPSLDNKLHRLPVISDFMQVDSNGKVTEKETSVAAVLTSYQTDEKQETSRKKQLYDQQPLLRVESLKTWFPARSEALTGKRQFIKAVDDVSFEVFPGETLGIVGESGCGKTTLGRTIVRLVEPTGGRVIYSGNDITKLNRQEMRRQRKRVQIIFQDPYASLNPRISIGEALMEPMTVHDLHQDPRKRKEKALELLELVNLDPSHFNRYPHEFSGGQRQRVVIARALAVQPEFIICDESVSALDVSIQAQVLNLLNDLKKDFGLSYIFISHDLSVVKFMCDRVIVMKKGKIEESGTPEKIYLNPGSPYTKKLIEAIPRGV